MNSQQEKQLYNAILHSDIKEVSSLFENNYFILSSSEYLLTLACEKGVKEIVFIILNNNTIPTHKKYDGLQIAIELGHFEVIKLLLEDPCLDLSSSNNWYIRTAVLTGDLDIVKFILSKGVDPSRSYNESIRSASANGYLDIVKLLLEDCRVNPHAQDNAPIREAFANNKINVYNFLFGIDSVKSLLKENYINIYTEIKNKQISKKIKGF